MWREATIAFEERNNLSLFFQVSIYAVPDKIHQADYALDTAVTLLEFYEDYFRIPYPLPKQGKDFAQFLQNEAFNDVSCGLYLPNWRSRGCLGSPSSP